jgi:ERCC4-type nuclease
MPTEFLKKIPGINSANIINIEKKVKNMVDLCLINEEELKKMINPKCATEVKNFLEMKVEI